MTSIVRERVILQSEHNIVELCLDKESGERFVRKIFDWEHREFAAREISVGMTVSHPNVAKLVDSFMTRGKVYLVYRYASNGDLFDYLLANPGLRRDVEWVARTFRSIVLGVQHMHERGVLHRDLKLENIIVTGDDNTQVCDFSFAEWIENPVGLRRSSSHGITKHNRGTSFVVDEKVALRKNTRHLVGTNGCISPETAHSCKATTPTDIYGLGVLLYEMVTGRKAFPGHTHDVFYPSWLEQSDGGQLVNLIQAMLMSDPQKRITADAILRHEWLLYRCKDATALPLSGGKSCSTL